QIFIEIGIRFLRNHGRLGYIVPDSILTLTNRRIIRKYIYHLTKIRELFHTGPKFKDLNVSNTIIILEKEESQIARENNTIQINLALNNEIKKKKLLQKQIKSWNYDFLIHIDKRDIKILDYLSSHFKSLGEIMDLDNYEISLSRGVELGKDGQVICCNNCGYYIPLPKKPIACFKCKNLDFSFKSPENIIIQEIPKKEENLYKSYIFALERYRVKEKRYINITKKGINYKNLDNYKNSILIRQISKNNHICATLNQDSSLTSQSIYNLRLIRSDIVEFNELYLLGLINSSLISFFFIKSFGSYKKLFPRILIEKLKSLPIKIPILESEKKIANEIGINVKKILNNKNRNFPNLSELIDELVFKLYDIPLSFREIVKNSFS
ncbi:MAG: TaqI-like C-terminal specificity domain-containing protein, partial [Promethearchaeota archaeon]